MVTSSFLGILINIVTIHHGLVHIDLVANDAEYLHVFVHYLYIPFCELFVQVSCLILVELFNILL